MRTLEYQAIEQDDGIRLELILKRRLGLSARQIRQLKFLSDGITVNGNRERIVYSVRSGDRIRVTFSEQNRNVQELSFLEKPLHILYEDEDLLVVDKKAGEVCHPAHGHYQDTLANQAAAYLAGRGAEKLQSAVSAVWIRILPEHCFSPKTGLPPSVWHARKRKASFGRNTWHL